MDRMAEGPMEKNGWMDEGFVTLMEATKVSLLGSAVWSVECGVWSVECRVSLEGRDSCNAMVEKESEIMKRPQKGILK